MSEQLDENTPACQDPFSEVIDGDQPPLQPYPTGGDDAFAMMERLCPRSAERAAVPYKTNLTAALVEQALAILATVRSPRGLTDPGVKLSCLASLADEAQATIERTVPDAKDHYSWEEIATLLGMGPTTARRRYSACVQSRHPAVPPLD
jgi:hypothetical protein